MINLLLGKWKVDPTDSSAVEKSEKVTMEFKDDGSLVYSIESEGKNEIILLTYEIDGNTLITDQPSKPREEKTLFELDSEGRLILEYNGKKSRYIKI